MLKEHKELLDMVTAAEAKARAIYEGGSRMIEGTVRTLRQVRRDTEARVKAYESAAKKGRSAAVATATPAMKLATAPTTDGV